MEVPAGSQYEKRDWPAVVFSSDNGPHREGGHAPDFFQSRGPLRGIKRDLYEGGIRVPFIARWPDLSKDLGEGNNVAAAHAEVVRRIEGILHAARTESPHFPISKRGSSNTPF